MTTSAEVMLTVIVLLLLDQRFRKQDFYAVEHILYDLHFIEAPSSSGRTTLRIERGAMLRHACRRTTFADYAAAKASFDYQEDLHSNDPMNGTEAIHRVYVISGWRKPANALLKDDKYRPGLLHYSPHQIMYARRKEAKEERLLGIENERDMAARRAKLAGQAPVAKGA